MGVALALTAVFVLAAPSAVVANDPIAPYVAIHWEKNMQELALSADSRPPEAPRLTHPYPLPAEIAIALAHKLAEAEHIDYVTPCPVDWSPRSSHCHDNAEEWVRLHPTWSVVRGWLHISGNVESGAMFDAHSVVRHASGQLWDVTQQTFHSFIRYDGPEAQFLAAVRDGPWVQITYLPATT